MGFDMQSALGKNGKTTRRTGINPSLRAQGDSYLLEQETKKLLARLVKGMAIQA